MIAQSTGWVIKLPDGRCVIPEGAVSPIVYRVRGDARLTAKEFRKNGYPEARVVKVRVTVEVVG